VGVTIHWQGTLLGAEAYTALIKAVCTFAEVRGWPTHDIERKVRQSLRVIDEQIVEYQGHTFGVFVRPDPNCEPTTFEFDQELFTQQSCKTQFAGPKIHIAVIELLRTIEPYFREMEVVDEGEYWDSSDEAKLRAHLALVDSALDDLEAGLRTASPDVPLSEALLDIASRKKH
jgi:hypothetical protein